MGNFHLAQFVVPLLFFALWALTSLFNRENVAQPPRTGRPFEPGGPRPQPPFAQRTPDRRPTTLGEPRPEPTRAPDRDAGIIILETETRRPTAGSAQRSGNAKRPPRGKNAPASVAKRTEKQTPRALTSSVAQSMSLLESHPVDLKPLTSTNTPLLSADVQQMPLMGNVTAQPSQIALGAIDVRQLVSSPSRIREAFIMSEILGPPVSRRNAPARPR